MSPGPRRLVARTDAPPRAARLACGGLEDAARRRRAAELAAAREAGRAEGAAEALQGAAAALDAAVARLEEARAALTESAARDCAVLAAEIARELLRAELAEGRYDIEAIVRETLACADTGHERCVVHLNPDDAARLAEISFRTGTELEPSSDLRRGDVHVTTSQGLLVRELDDRVAAIRERITGGLR